MTFSDEMLGDIQGAITGRILRVDLSTGTITTDRTEQFAKRWIGGQMLNSWLLLSETPRGTRWSDPGAPLIFGAGALSGTLVPSACRTSVDTINVFSGGKGSANMGGNFGPMLKFAGFDHIVIKGKAAAPTYLWVHGGRAELRDAAFLWGKTISETELALRRELSSRTLAVAAIGPAGEHKVKGACIVNTGGKVAGGSGVGCVMGDKNLKAIVVDGDGVVELADPERFMAASTSPAGRSMRRRTPTRCATKVWSCSATWRSIPRSTPTASPRYATRKRSGGRRRNARSCAAGAPACPRTCRRLRLHLLSDQLHALHEDRFRQVRRYACSGVLVQCRALVAEDRRDRS